MGIINEKDAETVETNIEDFNLKDFVNVQQALEDRIKQFNLIRDVYGNDYKKLYRRESLSPMGNRLNLAIPDVGVSRNVS